MSSRVIVVSAFAGIIVGLLLVWFDLHTPGRVLTGVGLLVLALQAAWCLIGWGLARLDASMSPSRRPPPRREEQGDR